MKSLTTKTDRVHIERQLSFAEVGVVRFAQSYDVLKPADYLLVTSNQTVYADISCPANTHAYNDQVVSGQHYELLLPPFSLVKLRLDPSQFEVKGYIFSHPITGIFPDASIRLLAADFSSHDSLADLKESLKSPKDRIAIASCTFRNTTIKAVDFLKANFQTAPDIAGVSQKVGVSAGFLSQSFKIDVGISPLSYRHRLQIMSAISGLSLGKDIADVAYEVGFSDISRFYKIFKKYYFTPPGFYSK